MRVGCSFSLTIIVIVGILASMSRAFQAPSQSLSRTRQRRLSTPSPVLMNKEKREYDRAVLLREEAESPFRKVRFFFYYALGGGALVSLAVSAAQIAAALNGINADLLQESSVNAAVDLVGIVVLAAFFQRDLQAQESRLKRATKGAELARLMVRGSKSLVTGDLDDFSSFTTSLASLRRGRGIEKRVIIAAGGQEKIADILQQATQLQDELSFNDLLVVPVVMPQGLAPDVNAEELPDCVALPVGSNWKTVVDDEASEAVKQGVNIEKEGFCVILKKNGRVGQRTKGIFLNTMVGEVTARRESGMDVKNI